MLKRIIGEQQRQHAAEIAELRSSQQQTIDARVQQGIQQGIDEAVEKAVAEAVKAAVAAILRRYYGPRSETFDPRQLLLFGQQIDAAPLDESSVEDEAGEPLKSRRARHKHGRQQLPDHLERVDIEHDIENKACPCCGEGRSRIGSDISEQLEYFPASFKVLRHIRYKYACGKCDADGLSTQIESAAKPSQPIEKGLAGPSLLAYVITSKLGDHLPLYRLERIFERQSVHIARSTMCAWMRCAGQLIQPLVELMAGRVKQSRAIHTDDTVVPIQEVGRKRCRQGRVWCYLGAEANPYTVYDYTPSRSREGPATWLDGYSGYLQADAYGGYDGIYSSQNVTEVACWAHARRKFYDAQDSDGRRATEMLSMVAELYAVEREASKREKEIESEKENEDDITIVRTDLEAHRLTLRQERSVPILARIKAWLDAERLTVQPRSPMAAAIQYAFNQWDALTTYTTEGFLSIDNNASERALKRVALGRKNWLFAGNDAAASTHALLWSLIASCERHGVDPQRYLTSVLAKIGQTPESELDQFLPDVWKQEDAAEPEPAVPDAVECDADE